MANDSSSSQVPKVPRRAELSWRNGVRMVIWMGVATGVVALRPGLWSIALRQLRAFARQRWYAKAPFLPIPDMRYMQFRMETLYGTPDALPPSRDLVEYLRWCRLQRGLWV